MGRREIPAPPNYRHGETQRKKIGDYSKRCLFDISLKRQPQPRLLRCSMISHYRKESTTLSNKRDGGFLEKDDPRGFLPQAEFKGLGIPLPPCMEPCLWYWNHDRTVQSGQNMYCSIAIQFPLGEAKTVSKSLFPFHIFIFTFLSCTCSNK